MRHFGGETGLGDVFAHPQALSGNMPGVITGLLLAAGAGTRMGGPKALARSQDGEPWLTRSVTALQQGGCHQVAVVLGAQADAAKELLTGTQVLLVEAQDWAAGQSASLRAGLEALTTSQSSAALIHLVDLPDVGPQVVQHVLTQALASATEASALLARASYRGEPGHPVLIGSAHWPTLLAELDGDQGARKYLEGRAVLSIECSHLASGRDQDHA